MKKTIIRTEFVRTLDGKTGRIKITFPAGYLAAYGIEGTIIEKTLLKNTLPSKQTTILAVNHALENIGFKGLVKYCVEELQGNYGHIFELREEFTKEPRFLKVDMKLLKKQRVFLNRFGFSLKKKDRELLDGIINMLDDVSDGLEDHGGVNLSVQKLR